MVNFARYFEKHDILIFCNLFVLYEHPAVFLYELVLFDLNTGNWDLAPIIFVVSHIAVWNEFRNTIARLMCHRVFPPICTASSDKYHHEDSAQFRSLNVEVKHSKAFKLASGLLLDA